jgi:hypothetical protein
MDFLSSGLFWLFFALVGVSLIIYEIGHSGRDTLRPALSLLFIATGGIASMIVLILSFIFMWWLGGVAILVSGFIWVIIASIVGNIVRGFLLRRS